MSSTITILKCPVCDLPLHHDVTVLSCENRHSFDQAKAGYFNLLLANQKSSKNPGDSIEMLAARRAFLSAGYYQPIAEAVSEMINALGDTPALQTASQHLSQNSSCKTLLDSGCGEGYYLQFINQYLQGDWKTYGLDIAKDAVRLAAKQDKNSQWFCGSAERLPFLNESLSVLLRIFSPGSIEEVDRVLMPEGFFINVVAGENHLIEIKRELYDEVRPYAIQSTPKKFQQNMKKNVTFNLQLENNEAVKQLLSMTPFLWNGKREAREAMLVREALSVTVDMDIYCFQKL